MSVSIQHETILFVYSFICGIICSCLFDFFRATRKLYKQSTPVIIVVDLLFWCITCVCCYFVIFKFNSGEIRIYYFAALIIGSFLYFLCISHIINKLFVNFLKFIGLIFKILLTPVTFLYKILMGIFIKIQAFFRRNIGGNYESENHAEKTKKHIIFKKCSFIHKRKQNKG